MTSRNAHSMESVTARKRVLVSWSTGKDSAWMVYQLRQCSDVELVALLTTFNQAADRVAMHAVHRELVEEQARQLGLPLWPIELPWPCSNEAYEDLFQGIFERAIQVGITHIAFGDLLLTDVRQYRIDLLEESGLEPLFPIWCDGTGRVTPQLARDMIAAGFECLLTCVDPRSLSPEFLGRVFNEEFLGDLPNHVDPCGERGEFHTFCFNAPIFENPIPVQCGKRVDRDGFAFIDLKPADIASEKRSSDAINRG